MLSVRSPGLMAEVFDRVIDSPKMLRNFVQIMRSGVVGRKSLGTLPKRLVRRWLEARTDDAAVCRLGRQRSVAGRHREDGSPEAGDEEPARRSSVT